jgi:hypothetical protein
MWKRSYFLEVSPRTKAPQYFNGVPAFGIHARVMLGFRLLKRHLRGSACNAKR